MVYQAKFRGAPRRMGALQHRLQTAKVEKQLRNARHFIGGSTTTDVYRGRRERTCKGCGDADHVSVGIFCCL